MAPEPPSVEVDRRGEVQYLPVRGLAQKGKQQFGQQESPSLVHGHHQVESLDSQGLGVREIYRGGVVDQNVHPAKLGGYSINSLQDLLFVSNVALDPEGLHAHGGQLLANTLDGPWDPRVLLGSLT